MVAYFAPGDLFPEAPGRVQMRRGDHRRAPRTGVMGPGSRPWLLLPFGGIRRGAFSIQPDRAPGLCHRGDEHRRNTVGLTAKAHSGVSSRPTTP